MGAIEVDAVRVAQRGAVLYTGVMTARDLLAISKVDTWRQENGDETGYQREPERPRGLAVARYLETDDSLLPTSVLLSFRGELGHRIKPVQGRHVKIALSDMDTLWQVDGQHRLFGLRIAIEERSQDQLGSFEVPFVLMEGLNAEDEADQFRIVNESAKKVRTDLARRLLLSKARRHGHASIIRTGRIWEVRAADITSALSSEARSPWHGRIQRPNEKKSQRHIIKELSFSNSLRPLVSLYPYSEWEPANLATAVSEYWAGWQDAIPEAFESPSDYVLLKTPGVFSLHDVARHIFEICRQRGIGLNRTEFAAIVRQLPEAGKADYWSGQNYNGAAMFGSMKGFGILADLIRDELNNAGFKVG